MATDIQNKRIAEHLSEAASLLERQGANRFRVHAYRRAADTIGSLAESAAHVFRTEGMPGLMRLPGVGRFIGGAIAGLVQTGEWTQLERLRGSLDPQAVFTSVPGIGTKLGRRILDDLHIDTLEALETAAYDGRLDRVPGFGSRRLAMVRSALRDILGRRWRTGRRKEEPSVRTLLEIDVEYREKANAGALAKIAPKRLNPSNVAWLPILHTQREGWHFTILFSNTALAHELGRTLDWVVIYFHTDSDLENQRTVVTETHGKLKGMRVVRGRELECEAYYNPVLFKSSVA